MQTDYWAERERMAEHHASTVADGLTQSITHSEAAGVFWSAYSAGRRFRVIRDGACLIHGSFGEAGGRMDLSIGLILGVRGWLSDADGGIHLVWATVDGRPIKGISGNDPHACPWAVFSPACEISYMPRSNTGVDNLPWPELATAPDPSFLQPVDETGNPQPW